MGADVRYVDLNEGKCSRTSRTRSDFVAARSCCVALVKGCGTCRCSLSSRQSVGASSDMDKSLRRNSQASISANRLSNFHHATSWSLCQTYLITIISLTTIDKTHYLVNYKIYIRIYEGHYVAFKPILFTTKLPTSTTAQFYQHSLVHLHMWLWTKCKKVKDRIYNHEFQKDISNSFNILDASIAGILILCIGYKV